MQKTLTPKTVRFHSLDVFRGAAVALMILVNNPGSWNHLFPPLAHAAWHGCTLTDLVFPFFLFAVGNALSFAMPRYIEKGRSYFLQKVAVRTALIFLLGFLLNCSPFFRYEGEQLVFKSWTFINDEGSIVGIRIMGVLQRIALSYFLAALIIYFFKSTQLYIGFFLLVFYWLLCFFLGGSDPYSLQGFFGTAVDVKLFGAAHLYRENGMPFDPEGLPPVLSSAAGVLIGYKIGKIIQDLSKENKSLMLKTIIAAGVVCVLAGFFWGFVFPLNKKIWSSSFALFSSGLAALTLAFMVCLIECGKWNGRASNFFAVFGKNPLFIFVLSGLLPRLLSLIRISETDHGKIISLSPLGWFYEHVCKNIASDLRLGSLLYALLATLFYWSIAYILDKKKIYIKV